MCKVILVLQDNRVLTIHGVVDKLVPGTGTIVPRDIGQRRLNIKKLKQVNLVKLFYLL